jgi:anti-sigma regulatory factor (Ser/Thr protein kinase)
MLITFFKWKFIVSFVAVFIVIGTFFYSNMLAQKIATQERKKVEQWVSALQHIASASDVENISLATIIVTEQQDIPVIETNEQDSIMSFVNLDSSRVANNKHYLMSELAEYKARGAFIKTYFDNDGKRFNLYYYGESNLLKQVRYFPLVQLLIVILFSFFMLVSIKNRYESAQNHLWAGLAKETAHQLGTPISALSGWVDILRHGGDMNQVLNDIQKDIDRLKLISERFSMIGGVPKKEERDIIHVVAGVVEYMGKRASEKTKIVMRNNLKASTIVFLSPPLIEWVLENLFKNALDSMEGVGNLTITLSESLREIYLDVSDSGKGMPHGMFEDIFTPGFTTRKRGWGVGLTLSRRIVEQYHDGQLFVKHSELGKGTIFRIVLKK